LIAIVSKVFTKGTKKSMSLSIAG